MRTAGSSPEDLAVAAYLRATNLAELDQQMRQAARVNQIFREGKLR